MKKSYIAIASGCVAAALLATIGYTQAQDDTAPKAAVAPAAPAPVSAEQAKKAFSYYIGFGLGRQISAEASTLTADDFDKDAFFTALQDAMSGKTPTMDQAELEAGMSAFADTLQAREAAAAKANLDKGLAFQAEFAKQEGVVKTESGLQYRVLTAGEGRKYDEAQDGKDAVCMVTYEGKLIDGTTFDKSEEPVPFPIGRVVPGFSEALKLMPIGSEWEICIPASLGYGEQGTGPIPGNSTLVFTMKLSDIKKNDAPAQMPMQLTPEMIQQLQSQGLEVMPDGE